MKTVGYFFPGEISSLFPQSVTAFSYSRVQKADYFKFLIETLVLISEQHFSQSVSCLLIYLSNNFYYAINYSTQSHCLGVFCHGDFYPML